MKRKLQADSRYISCSDSTLRLALAMLLQKVKVASDRNLAQSLPRDIHKQSAGLVACTTGVPRTGFNQHTAGFTVTFQPQNYLTP